MLKRKYTYQDRQVDGEPVEWKTDEEKWTLYTLSDGSTMKTKTVMLEVVRLDEYDQAGNPVYLFQAQQILNVVPNPQLAKPELAKKAN